jgi:hypothetical protein
MDTLVIRLVNVLWFVKIILLKFQLLVHQVHVEQMLIVENKTVQVLALVLTIMLAILMKDVALNAC